MYSLITDGFFFLPSEKAALRLPSLSGLSGNFVFGAPFFYEPFKFPVGNMYYKRGRNSDVPVLPANLVM